MKRILKRIKSLESALQYLDAEGNKADSGNLTGNVSGLRGNVSWLLTGNVSGLTGNVSWLLTGDVSGLRGNVSWLLTGDVSGLLRGDVSGLRGDVSGLTGNVDECGISQRDRTKGLSVDLLVEKDERLKASKRAK